MQTVEQEHHQDHTPTLPHPPPSTYSVGTPPILPTPPYLSYYLSCVCFLQERVVQTVERVSTRIQTDRQAQALVKSMVGVQNTVTDNSDTTGPYSLHTQIMIGQLKSRLKSHTKREKIHSTSFRSVLNTIESFKEHNKSVRID